MGKAPWAPPPELDSHAAVLAEGAYRCGLPFDTWLGTWRARPTHWMRFRIGERRFLFALGMLLNDRPNAAGPDFAHVNGAAVGITTSKSATAALIRVAGLSVPEGRCFDGGDIISAVDYARHLRMPVCVKPDRGVRGWYVYPHLLEAGEVRAAFRKASRMAGGVVVERHHAGCMLRFFYLHPRCVAAKHNALPFVTGDGLSPIEALVAAPSTGEPVVHSVGLNTRRALRAQGLDLGSVPALGRKVIVGLLSNVARGGLTSRTPDGLHPGYQAAAEAACRAVPGLKIGAVDMMVADPTQSPRANNHWILEINSSPTLADLATLYRDPPIGEIIITHLQEEHL